MDCRPIENFLGVCVQSTILNEHVFSIKGILITHYPVRRTAMDTITNLNLLCQDVIKLLFSVVFGHAHQRTWEFLINIDPLIFFNFRAPDSITSVNHSRLHAWISFLVFCFIYILNRFAIKFCATILLRDLEEFIFAPGNRFISKVLRHARWFITVTK